MCDPWQAEKFRRRMELVPDDACDGCLPDCEIDTYQVRESVTDISEFGKIGTFFLPWRPFPSHMGKPGSFFGGAIAAN